MPSLGEAYKAGVDAVVADPTINRGAFVDAMQTVITRGLSNEEGNNFVDALATLYESLGIINNATYPSLRGEIANEGADVSMALFDALAVGVGSMPEAIPVINAGRLMDLREERDNINAANDRLNDLIAAEPPGVVGKLVKSVLRSGNQSLAEYRKRLRDEIGNATGDPDS